MPRFRYSNALKKNGLGYNEQGFLYFLLRSLYCKCGGYFYNVVIDVCREVAGEDAQALYEFLTDRYRNHTFVSAKYYISEKRLFKWKNEAYHRLAARLIRKTEH